MTVRAYYSTDAGAPVLTGQAGSLVQLLDACLVNGYSGGATARAPLGWSKPFSGTDKAAYRTASARDYLRVQDNADGFAGTLAVVAGFGSMSTVDAGTEQFPATTVYALKSITANTTARPWVLYGDEEFFYLFVQNGNSVSTATWWNCLHFGAIIADKPDDPYPFVIGGYRPSADTAVTSSSAFGSRSVDARQFAMRRDALEVQAPVEAGALGLGLADFLSFGVYQASGVRAEANPSPATGRLNLWPIYLKDRVTSSGRGSIRGRLPGVYFASQNFGDGTFSRIGGGVGLESRTLEMMEFGWSNSTVTTTTVLARLFFDITGDWR